MMNHESINKVEIMQISIARWLRRSNDDDDISKLAVIAVYKMSYYQSNEEFKFAYFCCY